MTAEHALKKIVNFGRSNFPDCTPSMFNKMARSELALRALERTLVYAKIYMKNADDLLELKKGLMRLADDIEEPVVHSDHNHEKKAKKSAKARVDKFDFWA